MARGRVEAGIVSAEWGPARCEGSLDWTRWYLARSRGGRYAFGVTVSRCRADETPTRGRSRSLPRSSSWRRSRTVRLRRSAVPRSRHRSPRRRSLPTCSPSSSGRSRSPGAPLPRSRRRRPCERASRRRDARAHGRRGAWSRSAPPPRSRWPSSPWWPCSARARRASSSARPSRPPASRPGAAGEATLTKTSSGWRIELDATGLPRRADGLFYEAWLRSPAGVLVPIGTFNEGRKVTLWAGVSPKDFPTLTVTRERADGDQASSGEKVLVGRHRGGTQLSASPRRCARPAGGRGKGGSSPSPRGSAGPGPPPCRRGR